VKPRINLRLSGWGGAKDVRIDEMRVWERMAVDILESEVVKRKGKRARRPLRDPVGPQQWGDARCPVSLPRHVALRSQPSAQAVQPCPVQVQECRRPRISLPRRTYRSCSTCAPTDQAVLINTHLPFTVVLHADKHTSQSRR
jgi:hypothetical protein